ELTASTGADGACDAFRVKLPHLPAAVRFDSGWWRRFAELGCVYGPEWWKRGSPPVIAAIIFAIARGRREAVLRNQRPVRGPRWPRAAASWCRRHTSADGTSARASSPTWVGP